MQNENIKEGLFIGINPISATLILTLTYATQ